MKIPSATELKKATAKALEDRRAETKKAISKLIPKMVEDITKNMQLSAKSSLNEVTFFMSKYKDICPDLDLASHANRSEISETLIREFTEAGYDITISKTGLIAISW